MSDEREKADLPEPERVDEEDFEGHRLDAGRVDEGSVVDVGRADDETIDVGRDDES